MQVKTISAFGVFATLILQPGDVHAQSSPTARGEALARKHCARCHAIGEKDMSPMRPAPPFRDLSKRYPIENLQEALAEGIVVGHPAMPPFRFEPREINALLTYISRIQSHQPTGQKEMK